MCFQCALFVSMKKVASSISCDLNGIVLSKLNPSMTHPGPTKFGEDRHLNTWEEYGDKQANNKQTLLEF